MDGEAEEGVHADGGAPAGDSGAQVSEENVPDERSLLELFVGRRPRKYMRTYDKAEEGRPALTLNWAAFFVPLPWLLYRKLYLEGAVFAIVPALVAFVYLPASQILSAFIGMLFFLFGHGYYVFKALNRIEAIEAGSGSDAEKEQEIQHSGGVSRAGAWIGVVVVTGMFGYFGYAAYVAGIKVAKDRALATRQLPACDAQPARDLVKKALSDAMAKRDVDASDIVYAGFVALGDSSADVRRCGFQISDGTGNTGLKFEISWESADSMRYLVRLTGAQKKAPAARELPMCDAQRVRDIVQKVLSDALAKQNIDGKDVVYSNFSPFGSASENVRRCGYEISENGEVTRLKFEISWQTPEKEGYQVRLTGAR